MVTAKEMPVLPLEAYTSPEWFDREQQSIFSQTWQFAGFVEDLSDPGDYLTLQAGLNNILVLLDRGKQLQLLSTICAAIAGLNCYEPLVNARPLSPVLIMTGPTIFREN